MDDARFDEISRRIASRRMILGGLSAALVALAGSLPDLAAGKPKKKKKKKKKCASGAVRCGTACVNLQTDAQHCGACGVRCGNGVACVNGTCPSSCTASQIRCVDLCVDPTSNENHCGGCSNKCKGDETCLNGVCGCADRNDTSCPNNLCVDLQTDDEHCGVCGNACNDNATCRNGVCTASQCSANEIDCGSGRCIPDVAHACCNQGQCGGDSSANPLVCRNDRCVCKTAGEGICNFDANGNGNCHVCCPGGSGNCSHDQVCSFFTVTSGGIPVNVGVCDCPTGWQRCQFNHPAGTCVQYPSTTPDKCGPNCEICSAYGEGSICCGGRCSRGCNPGDYCQQSTICNPGCNPCGAGKICCNQGPDTPPSCIEDRQGGICYRINP